MKLLLSIATVLTFGTLLIAQRGERPPLSKGLPLQNPKDGIVHFTPDKTHSAIYDGFRLMEAPDLIVLGSHRDQPGNVEIHDTETDVMYIMDGEATLITGGKMIGGKVTRPGQWAGTSIEGGDTYKIGKGDIFVIRPGVPHWFKEVNNLSYYVTKVIKQ